MSKLPVHSRPVAYDFSCLPDDHPGRHHFTIRIEYRGKHGWAVVNPSGYVLDRFGRWDFEPQNSSRTDEWLSDNRWTFVEAVERAEYWAPLLHVAGKTVEDALAPGGWHG